MAEAPKISGLVTRLRECLETGNYLDTRHSLARQAQRNVTREETLQVLRVGEPEPSKDRYDENFQTWNYSIRGKTVEGKELRVVVSFEGERLLFITTIPLGRKG